MIRLKCEGNFKKTNSYLSRMKELAGDSFLDKYGKQGVEALKAATPVDTGKTADSWSYEIAHKKDKTMLIWSNSNIQDGVNVAVILQYGHATYSGTYVKGIDYINPALKPILDQISADVEKEAKSV